MVKKEAPQKKSVFIFGLKGEVATVTLGPGGNGSAQSHAVQQALYGFRELEMKFIETLTNAFQEDPNTETANIVSAFQAQRNELVHKSEIQAKNGEFGNSPRLLEVIEQFCNH